MEKIVSDYFARQKGAAGLQLLKVNRQGVIKLNGESEMKRFFNIEENLPSIEGFQIHKSMFDKNVVYEKKEDGGILRYVSTHGGGIYMIHCIENGKTYVGRSINVRKRMNEHSYYLKKGKHHNAHLQNAFDKYGSESFIAIQIESSDNSDVLGKKELFWAKKYKVFKKGFNIAPISNNAILKTAYGMKLAGEHNGNSKLTNVQVIEMCGFINENIFSMCELAEKYSIAVRTASAIRKGFRWKEVTCDYISDEIKQSYWIN